MTPYSRCCLVVPGSSERFLTKARKLEVDEVVIDLEDAVPPREKAARVPGRSRLRQPADGGPAR